MGRSDESGAALLSALLVTVLMAGLVAGMTALAITDGRVRALDGTRVQAFYAAHAGLEKLTADLGDLFSANPAPTSTQINAIGNAAPTTLGVQWLQPDGTDGYTVDFPVDGAGDPLASVTTVSSGPFEGLVALATPYQLTATARLPDRTETSLTRQLQTVAIPVFQFGLFSENDQSFHAGDDFSFGGRVHTNGNSFIAAASGATLTLSDKVTAVGEIIRNFFPNGRSSTHYSGNVRMAKSTGCQPPPAPLGTSCRNLAQNEGSLVGDIGSAPNTNWTSLSVGTYNSYLRTTLTGARRLDLPLVSGGAEPIDIIRRPPTGGPEPQALADQRYFNMASLRILLSDSAAELTGLPGVVGTPISLETAALPAGAGAYPLAASTGVASAGYRSAANTPLLGGFILINKQSTAGTWTDVTAEILNLGVTGRNLSNGSINNIGSCGEPHPNAVIRIQRIKDVPATSPGPSPSYCNLPTSPQDYWPNTLYDPREGLRRDNEWTGQDDVYPGGVMHYVELDVTNFKQWIEGSIGTSGLGSQDVTGYVVYFSDRRTNKNGANQETGEYGWEDFINTDNVSTPNGVLDVGEDMNGSGTLETYGNTPIIPYAVVGTGGGPWGGTAINASTNVYLSQLNTVVARANRAVFFRRALKLVNGGLGSLPSNNLQGVTFASENPVYVEGNFNACGASTANCNSNGFGPTGDAHRSAAIIADAVTLLSRTWNDLNSFNSPHSMSGRIARTTWYRMAVISGKGINFPYPNNNPSDPSNFGSDGGAHNFLRFIENWSSANPTVYYRGSMVSLFFSRQGIGTWKCCQNVYWPPSRGAFFETEFLTPSLLPPRTPMFRDVNITGFSQIIKP